MNSKKDYSLLTTKVEIKEENFVSSIQQQDQSEVIQSPSVSYLRDSFRRFIRNKASLVSFIIIVILALFSIITPIASPFAHVNRLTYNVDGMHLAQLLPKCKMFENTGFWDGTDRRTINDATYYLYKYYDTTSPILKEYGTRSPSKDEEILTDNQLLHDIRFDSYAVGSVIVNLSKEDYLSLESYQKEKHLKIILPQLDSASYLKEYRDELLASSFHYTSTQIDYTIANMEKEYSNNCNITYKIVPLLDNKGQVKNNNVFFPRFDEGGNITSLYKEKIADKDGDLVDATIKNGTYQVRVDFYQYFIYTYGFEPIFLFGSNSAGQDVFYRLGVGTLFSLGLGILVSLVNFAIGLIYGAIEGYYGGKVDLVMERISDILVAIPSTILLVIFNVYFNNLNGISSSFAVVLGLFVAFILTGWISVSSTTRLQFYRFKNKEYVTASRYLGASDRRLIFHHILPNALGTLITSTVLMVPSVIFSESALSYLGIIDFSTSGISSVGQLLNEGSAFLGTPNSYLLVFPCIVVSLLMICFNIFGNGLRDAFNPSLKEE